MKPSGTILLMLLAAAIASVITYLAVSNARLRETIAQREAAERAVQLAAAQSAGKDPAKPTPQPWRAARLNTNSPSKTMPTEANPEKAVAEVIVAPAPSPGVDGLTPVVLGGRAGFVAGPWTGYLPLPGSKVRIEGTSSLHPWEVTGSVIGGGLLLLPGSSKEGVFKAGARIPVRTLKSYQKTMDEVMQDTMEMSRFPNIDYQLIKLEFRTNSMPRTADYDALGALTVHGVTITNTMLVAIENLEDMAKLKITGTTPLKMTDFGMKPVDVNLGIGHITTGNDVTVTFEWLVGRER